MATILFISAFVKIEICKSKVVRDINTGSYEETNKSDQQDDYLMEDEFVEGRISG